MQGNVIFDNNKNRQLFQTAIYIGNEYCNNVATFPQAELIKYSNNNFLAHHWSYFSKKESNLPTDQN